MVRVAGVALVRGRIACTTQAAWLEAGSVRDNILCGAPMRVDWYAAVIDACCLEADLLRFEQGDAMEVGERGVRLSDGQQARVALARAVYADADVYVLDEPFEAAIDNVVTMRMWDRCIRGLLTARGKAVVITSHNRELLELCDNVIVLSAGAATFNGHPAGLPETDAEAAVVSPVTLIAPPEAARPAGGAKWAVPSLKRAASIGRHAEGSLRGNSMKHLIRAAKASSARTLIPSSRSGGSDPASAADVVVHVSPDGTSPGLSLHAKASMVPWYGDDRDGAESIALHSKAAPPAPAPTVATHMTTLLRYLRGTRGNIAIAAVVFALLALGTQQVYKWWLTVLLTAMAKADSQIPRLLGVFVATVVAYVAAIALSGITVRSIASHASLVIHRDALVALLRAPLAFFVSSHVESHLAVLSRDLEMLDATTPVAFNCACALSPSAMACVVHASLCSLRQPCSLPRDFELPRRRGHLQLRSLPAVPCASRLRRRHCHAHDVDAQRRGDAVQ